MYWIVTMSGEKDNVEEEIEYCEFDNEDDAWDTHREFAENIAPELASYRGYTEVVIQTVQCGRREKLIRETVFFCDGAVNDTVF